MRSVLDAQPQWTEHSIENDSQLVVDRHARLIIKATDLQMRIIIMSMN